MAYFIVTAVKISNLTYKNTFAFLVVHLLCVLSKPSVTQYAVFYTTATYPIIFSVIHNKFPIITVAKTGEERNDFRAKILSPQALILTSYLIIKAQA
jgi:hypothetical protein